MSMYTPFRYPHSIARQRRRQGSTSTAASPANAAESRPAFAVGSQSGTASHSSSPAATTEPQQRPVSLVTMSSVSSMRNDQESAGMSEVPSSYPSSVADNTTVASTPTYEYYGFVIYLVSLAAFIVYLLWAYLPDEALEAVGITYYPDRYWAVALPAWWMMAIAFILLFNFAMNMYNTPLLSSPDNITDPYSNLSEDMAEANTFYYEKVGGIPPVCDIPISLVNECLYQ